MGQSVVDALYLSHFADCSLNTLLTIVLLSELMNLAWLNIAFCLSVDLSEFVFF